MTKTYTATVYVGTKERATGEVRPLGLAREYLKDFASGGGVCVSFTPTEFIYKDGMEPGIVVGLINYPRFPESLESIKAKALAIAEGLQAIYRQLKVSVVFPDETVMLEAE